jgi:hypothetical protein
VGTSKNPTIRVELASPTATDTPESPTTKHHAPQPQEQVVIPVRPAAVTVANVLTTASAAAAVSGPVGWAILGGAGVATAAVVQHQRTRRRQRDHHERTTQTRRLGRLGRDSGALGGLGLGGFGRGFRKSTRAGHGRPAGNGHRDPLGSLTGALRRATSPKHHGGSGHGPNHRTARPRGRGHHPHIGGSRTPHGPLGRLGHRIANTPLGRAARRAAPAIRATGKIAKAVGITTLGILGGLGTLLTQLWHFLRWLVWKIRKLLKPGENDPEQTSDDAQHVRDTVDDPGPSDDTQQRTSTNRPNPQPGRTPNMSGTQGTNPMNHQGTSPLWMIIKAACDQIAGIQHKGNMTTRAEAYDMAAAIALIGQVIGLRANSYRRESLDPTFVDLYVKAEAAMYAVANQLLPLGTYFDALHPERVRDLLSGNNPQAWDTTQNQTTS